MDYPLKSRDSHYNYFRCHKHKKNMSKKLLKASLPHLNLLTKVILILAILVMVGIGALGYRTSKGPIDLTFLKPKIEQALSDPSKGYQVRIEKIGLIWPHMTDPLLLDLQKVKIIQKEQDGLSVDSVALGLSARYMLIGQIKPAIVVVDGPVFQLVQEDGSYNFFWQDDAKTAEEISELPKENIKKTRKDIRQTLEKILNPKGTEFEILSALRRVELTNVVIKGKDISDQEEGVKTDYLALIDLRIGKSRYGLQGDLAINFPSEEGKKSYIRSDIVYRRDKKDITFTASVQDVKPESFVPLFPEIDLLKKQNLLLDGQVRAAFDDRLKLQMATVDLNMPEGKIIVPDLYDEGLDLKNIIFNAYLNRPERKLDITNFQATVGNVPVEMKAAANFDKGKMIAPITLKISEAQTDRVSEIFPKAYIDTSAGEWIGKRLSKGRVHDVVFSADLEMARDAETKQRHIDLLNSKASFKAEGVTVKYHDTLMAVENVVGEGSYEADALTIKDGVGNIKDIKGTNVQLKMTDLSKEGGGMAYLSLDASGPFKTALEYASDEPIGVGDTLGFDIKTVQGHIDFHLDLEFPTLKDLPKDQVIVKIKGKLNDVTVPNIVRGLPLTGGPYDLFFADGAIELKGSGELAQRPVTLTWKEYLDAAGKEFESKITAKISADEGLRKAFGIGLEDYISGPIPVDVTYVDYGADANIDVKGDLNPAVLHIDPFDFEKSVGVAGDLSLTAHMKGDTLEEVDDLSVVTKGFSLSNGRILFKKLSDGSTDISRGMITQAVLGKTKAAVDFEITSDNTLKAVVNGSVIDASPFIKTDKKTKKNKEKAQDHQPMKVSVDAQKLLMDKGEVLYNSKIYFETDKQSDITWIEMDSKVGDGDMYLRFKPEEGTGKRTFRLESSDAGYTLKAFGLNDKVRGGKMTIYGQPQQGDNKGDLYGKAVMENFRVVKAPALAKLLSVMSLTGVQNLLNNEGLTFAKLESDFEWRFREAGNLLVVKDGRTSGSALGLTFEGVVNQATDETDISGTVIPLSEVNNVIGNIPVLGKVLTGGKAFFAATYKIKGPSGDPNVSVNPLSVLAPGFLRTILFEENVDSKVKKAQ